MSSQRLWTASSTPDCPPWTEWDKDKIQIFYDLGVTKGDLTEDEQHEHCINILKERKLEFKPRTCVFSDGSVMPDKNSAGAYVILRDDTGTKDFDDWEIVTWDSMFAGTRACSFTAEVTALESGTTRLISDAELLQLEKGETILIVVDCQGMLTCMNKGPITQTDAMMENIWENVIRLAAQGYSVVLQFIFSHCRLKWNDYVDGRAKQRANMAGGSDVAWQYRDMRAAITRAVNSIEKDETAARQAVALTYRETHWKNEPITDEEALWSRAKQSSAAMIRSGQSTHVGTYPRKYDLSLQHECRIEYPPPPKEDEADPETQGAVDPSQEETPVFPCPHCAVTRCRIPRLNDHIQQKHPGLRLVPTKAMQYICTHCQPRRYQTAGFDTMEKHYAGKHPTLDFDIEMNEADQKKAMKLILRGKRADIDPDELETIPHIMDCPGLEGTRKEFAEKSKIALEKAIQDDGDKASEYVYSISKISKHLHIYREAVIRFGDEAPYEDDITVVKKKPRKFDDESQTMLFVDLDDADQGIYPRRGYIRFSNQTADRPPPPHGRPRGHAEQVFALMDEL